MKFPIWAGILAFSALAVADTQTADREIVILPEVTVSAKLKLRPEEKWLTGRLENFEIYSHASEKTTRELITKFYTFHQAFTHLFPKSKITKDRPIILVLCNGPEEFNALAPKKFNNISTAVGDAYNTYLLIDLKVCLRDNGQDSIDSKELASAVNSDNPAQVQVPTQYDAIDGETLIRREYIHLLFHHNQPRPPLWLEEGMAMYFSSMEVRKNDIKYANIDESVIKWFNGHGMMDLPEFLTLTPDSPKYDSDFSRQAMIFLHHAMFARKMRYQKAFLEFINLPAKEQANETVFRKYFGMGFNDMDLALISYTEGASWTGSGQAGGWYRAIVAPKPVSFPPEPAYELRETADAENGRLKGDILRLAKRHDDANIELLSPVLRRHSDARLVATLGRLKYEIGDLRSARQFLEQAVAANVGDPAAYVTLARIRLDEALLDPARKEGLNASRMNAVLKPLYTAHALGLRHPNLYLLIAEAWEHSRTPAHQDALDLIDDGVRQFPQNVELVYRNAVLKIRSQRVDDARLLIDHGLKATRDEATKARFQQLKDTLLSAPAAATPAKS